MNDQLQNALTDFVNRLTVLVDSGTAQLPAVLQDIIAYKLFSAWFDAFIGVVLLAIAAALVIWGAAAPDDDYSDRRPVSWTASAIIGLMGVLFTVGGAWHVYYVTHFPRLVILDYLKGLL
jgi:hypothetical protein